MANKVIDSNLQVNGNIKLKERLNIKVGYLTSDLDSAVLFTLIKDAAIMQALCLTHHQEWLQLYPYYLDKNVKYSTIGRPQSPWTRVYSEHFIVPNGTASQFLKADGSLDSSSYALHTDLNSIKNNAWKLDEANAEVSTVVVALQGDMSVFAAMEKAGINYQTSRNIYVDMSEADFTITDIFAGYENLPVGIRYHIFFGNTKHDCKINWNESKVESNLVPSLGITPAYPTAKCEFMRVTEEWTYADWEAKIENVSHTIDTGTASESDNSTLINFMDNNKIPYIKTANGGLADITALLAALANIK